jgi:hypothetical protein
MRRVFNIGIAASDEFGPMTAHEVSQISICLRVIPVGWERITQEEKLFAMVCTESRTFAGINVSKVVQVRLHADSIHRLRD